ncbi:caspase domain-containing protein [Mycena rebaudengoi]|nr:caspase domain-containing protein [Mycena rebaudengoi]
MNVEKPNSPTAGQPSKKALLIGIGSELPGGYAALRGPHKDVKDMRQLLIDQYQYQPGDITVLIDEDGIAENLQPTRANILAAMTMLVKDARSNDFFFFHYSGHSTQIPNEDGSEDDGKDECLVPLGGESQMIVDDELNAVLVAPLPVDAHLVAVLDTCHSGSLLDLKHYRSKDTEWVEKGRQRSEAGIAGSDATSTTRRVVQTSRISPTHVSTQRSLIDVVSEAGAQSPSRTKARWKSFATRSIGGTAGQNSAVLRTTVSRLRATSLRCDLRALSDDENAQREPELSAGAELSRIPVAKDDDVKADVVSIAASRDSQRSWEDEKGRSMTAVLIELLKEDPHPSYANLLTRISHATNESSLTRHRKAKLYEAKQKKYQKIVFKRMTKLKRVGSAVSLTAPAACAPGTLRHSATLPIRLVKRTTTRLSVYGRNALMGTFHKCRKMWNEALKAEGGDMDAVQDPELGSSQPLKMQSRLRL